MIICLLVGCQNNKEDEADNEIKYPDVMFAKMHYYSSSSVIGYYIDKEGNIRKFEYINEMVKFYDEFIRMEEEVVITVNQEELYSVFDDFAKMDNLETEYVYEGDVDMNYKGKYRWYGYRYNSDDEIEYILLSGQGDSYIKNKNEKVLEIVEWMDNVINDNLKDHKY